MNTLRSLLVSLLMGGCLALSGPLFSADVMKAQKLREIDREIEGAIARGEIPGAVLHLESKGEVYEKAYGRRLVTPGSEAMTSDTIFDLASLTKVMATTPAILKLLDDGRLSLDDPVSKWIPEFLNGGVRKEATAPKPTASDRERITVKHLLTHQSGLPAGLFLSEGDFWGYEEGVNRAATVGLLNPPGTRFRYSDVNFILLGEIVRRVSGERLDQFTKTHIYEPLGMEETSFQPPIEWLHRIAPTTTIPGYGLLRGEVHDPTARRMEGVAGHAGLFSSAKDTATYLRFFLTKGASATTRILSADIIEASTRNQLPPALEAARGLGWDLASSFSHQRGEKFPLEGYGHTGWTGPSIWIDPPSQTFLILLTNRNHPSEDGRTKPLRIAVGTLAAEAVGYTEEIPSPTPLAPDAPAASAESTPAPAEKTTGVLNGIDVLERDHFSALAGLKIGLVTNQTGINRERRSTIDLFAESPAVDLKVLFSPEHGIRGTLDVDFIDDATDAATGLPIYSLYRSEKRKPSPEQLAGLDALVFDIQDIGCRFYTYVSTMGLAMEAAAKAGLRFIVLDRVNPIGGIGVGGPIREGEGNDFVAFHDLPVQHGLTVGELAQLFNAERQVRADLTVIPVEGWDPAMRFDETGLPWVNPSPNMRSLTEAILYPGVGLIEFTNVSVGRGTSTPFEHIGAPWINEGRLARRLRDEAIPGLTILPTKFTPDSSVYAGEDCSGVRFYLSDRDLFSPLDLGLALMRSLYELYPNTFNLEEKGNVLLRHPPTIQAILAHAKADKIHQLWQPGLEDYLQRRQPFLLYPRP